MIPIFIDSGIPPLTKEGKNGKVYFRRELVSRQIESLREMPESELLSRVIVRQEEESGSLKSETLVFLIRALRRNFPGAIFEHLDNAIAETLAERIARIVGPLKPHFEEDPNKEDSFGDFRMGVVATFFLKVCKTDADDADYAEVSFGQFIVGLARNELKKYFNEKKRLALHDVFEEPDDLERAVLSRALYSRDIERHLWSSDTVAPAALLDRADILKKALNVLPEPSRTAWLLRHAESWEIESQDESAPTLAKYFKVSGRTIRNWLSNAENQLTSWRAPAE
jgi:DNA-directed RNA polymerase specialized sigma24 family protein